MQMDLKPLGLQEMHHEPCLRYCRTALHQGPQESHLPDRQASTVDHLREMRWEVGRGIQSAIHL